MPEQTPETTQPGFTPLPAAPTETVRAGFTPIISEAPTTINVPVTQGETIPPPEIHASAQEILQLAYSPSRAVRVDVNGVVQEITEVVEKNVKINGKPNPYEDINLPDAQIAGIRMPADKNLVSCADAVSIMEFSFLGTNGATNRVRLLFLADGVGNSGVGHYASRICVNKALEDALDQTTKNPIKNIDGIKSLIGHASGEADASFHAVPRAAFRVAFEKELDDAHIGGLAKTGAMALFDEKDTGMINGIPDKNPDNDKKRRGLASTTLLALAVVDQPDRKDAPITVLYQNGGDGGFDVGAGYNHDNFCLDQSYQPAVAPEQINYDRPARDQSFYANLISQHQFERPEGKRMTVTLRTDGLDKLRLGGKERSAEEMLDISMELQTAMEHGTLADPALSLAKMATNVPDDVTYLMIRS